MESSSRSTRPVSPHRDRRSRLAVPTLCLGLWLAGCTVHVSMPELTPQHPANPEAAVTPLPPPSPLLDSYRREVPPAEELPAMDHSGHGGEEGEPAADGGHAGHANVGHPEADGDQEMEHEAGAEGGGHEGMDHEGMDHHGMHDGATGHEATPPDSTPHDSTLEGSEDEEESPGDEDTGPGTPHDHLPSEDGVEGGGR